MCYPLRKFSFVAVSLLFLFAATNQVVGKDLEFPQHNCGIKLPYGWGPAPGVTPRPELVAAFRSEDKTKAFTLIVVSANRSRPIDEQFVSAFNRNFEETGGGKLTSGKFIEVAGLKGYERIGYSTTSRTRASTLVRVISTKTALYSLQFMHFDGEANEDAEIRRCLESFRFLQPPAPPVDLIQPSPIHGVIQAVVGLGIIAAGVWACIALAFRNKRNSCSTPSSLPKQD